MAQRVLTILDDDLDGTEAADTVSFAFQGVEYQIDLSEKNIAKFEKAIQPYLEAGRRVGGRRRSVSAKATSNGELDTKAVRSWAVSNGIEVSSRGRISADVLDQYRAAGN